MDVVESGSILPENTVGVSDIVSAGTEQWSNLGKSAIPRHFVGIGLSQLPGVGRCQDRVHISKNTDIWQLNTYGVAVHTVETIPGPQMSSQPGRETCDEFVSTSCPFLPVFVYINELRISAHGPNPSLQQTRLTAGIMILARYILRFFASGISRILIQNSTEPSQAWFGHTTPLPVLHTG